MTKENKRAKMTLYCSPEYQTSLDVHFRRSSSKIHFQDDGCGGHRALPIGTILAIFDLQVISIGYFLLSPVKWPFGSGEDKKNCKMAAILDF